MEDYLEEKDLYKALNHITQNVINIAYEKDNRKDVGERIAQFKIFKTRRKNMSRDVWEDKCIAI